MTEYEKDLNELKEQILKEGDTLVTKRALLERFCEMDKEYNGEPWNLLQILANINVLIGEEPCEDCVSRQAVLDIVRFEDKWLSDTKSDNADTRIAFTGIKSKVAGLPPVTPTQRWIPIVYREATQDEKDSYFTQNGEELCFMIESEMPENGQEVLVSSNGYVSEDIFDEDYYSFENHEIVDVDAWMPLPKAYKAEMEGEE
ncbi:hypothetical protein SAMN05216391_10813 [Lachnospiraceae bacterium KHCPX20]|nr:hypothetical protein SAMN05216391_10813 [Lachnospiraceae bacterium KHCPX20]